MAEIIPFRGILYNASKIFGEDVVAPPYDIITLEYREELYSKSPYNIVRVDLGKELKGDSEAENKYTRAAEYFNSWLKDEILLRSQMPGFYVYGIDYRVRNQSKKLRGFFSLVRLEELGKGNIHPHECTYSKPKADRLNVMRACNANISPIFSLYNSPEKKASKVIEKVIHQTKPYMEAKDLDGAVHRLWITEDKKDIETIKDDLKGKAVFIADGHHRYETALELQKEMDAVMQRRGDMETSVDSPIHRFTDSPKPWNYVLMFLTNIADDRLTILPTHRLVRDMPEDPLKILSGYFDIETLSQRENIEEGISKHEHAIGFFQHDNHKQYILRHKGSGLEDVHPALRGLEVTILHELIFKRLLHITDIEYEMGMKETIEKVKSRLYDAAFFLNPTKVEAVERVALSDVRMPPKSTYFYPKPLTGMVMYKFSE